MSEPTRRPIVVVTGGSAGIGRAAVREFASAGYDVAILARGQAGIDGAVADVEELGGTGLGLSVDVSKIDEVESATDRIEAELGEIDVWVNNAFVGSLAPFWETSPEEFERMTDVTYYGQVNGTRAALRVMRGRDRGAIVNVSSSLAHRAIPLQSAYCGAKHAVKGFTESVRVELRASGSAVTIGLVTLPGVNTTQFNWNLNRMPDHPQPVAPILEPETVAKAIVSAAQHPRRNTWVGIATAYTVLGNRIAPWFMDRYLARTGIDGQQTDEDAPRWGSNLFEPQDADVDRGARGPFSDKSGTFDPVSLVSRRAAAVKSRLGL
ncbi:SDR family oxidoreductase [Aeromicrobium endophyticum]|uniref:SDR family NAD(P)-dependent oxidoreductase n=1 Tax=Aeromicrobium endophyticum TaxID=2292704 RepID=A0A371PEF6_9ACTN|nr:SDR family oxidoreductase [Aeromicrobium endophyticum]REK74026.1 SDR family NAD(P)-dependent oxidoreductase [Aeromicrobium endophyticum]